MADNSTCVTLVPLSDINWGFLGFSSRNRIPFSLGLYSYVHSAWLFGQSGRFAKRCLQYYWCFHRACCLVINSVDDTTSLCFQTMARAVFLVNLRYNMGPER